MTARLAITAAVAILLHCPIRPAAADWLPNGTAVTTAIHAQARPVAIADGAGGSFMAWADARNGTDYNLFVQHMNAAGVPLWTPNGVLVTGAACSQSQQVLAPDGAGGVFIAWTDSRIGPCPSENDLYVQHIAASGVRQSGWASDGIVLCDTAGVQRDPVIVSDGVGGAIVAWDDMRNGVNLRIYAQRVTGDGVLLWHALGIRLTGLSGQQGAPAMIPDGAGGAILAFHGGGADFDIVAMRLLPSGSIASGWPVTLCSAIGDQFYPAIVSDGAGGAIVAWQDRRNDPSNIRYDIYAQRVNSAGTIAGGWPSNGVPLCVAAGDQLLSSSFLNDGNRDDLVSDGAGGAIVTWYDERGADQDVYVQRVTGAGAIASGWTINGVALCAAVGDQSRPLVASAGTAAIVTWQDERGGGSNVYAQRVDLAGAPTWTANGVTICSMESGLPVVVADGASGAIIAWQDDRAGATERDIYSQRVGGDGSIGPDPLPPWDPNGSPVTTANSFQQHPTLVGDDKGGAIFAWENYVPNGPNAAAGARVPTTRAGLPGLYPHGPGRAEIRVVRLDEIGDVGTGWPASGTAGSTQVSNQLEPVNVEDGAGGTLVVWKDDRNGGFDLYAQRITASGSIAAGWPAAGVAICTATGDQQHPSLVPDGLGGAIVFWEDGRGATVDIYAQSLAGNGTVAWTTNGIAVVATTGDQLEPDAISDGAGGAIVAWMDHRSDSNDIYAMRVTMAGGFAAGWPANGRRLSGTTGEQIDPTVVADGEGGAIVAWGDSRSDSSDVRAQRVNGFGTVLWTANGLPLGAAVSKQQRPNAVADGAGGAIVAWEDGRDGATRGFDLYAMRVDGSANFPAGWAANGNPLCIATGDQQHVTLVGDGRGGAIASWEDGRAGNVDVYANQIGAAGAIDARWPANGIVLCDATGSQIAPGIVSDGTGGAVVGWTDGRVTETDVYATHLFGESSASPTTVGPAPIGSRLEMLPPRPNPARASMVLTFTLPARTSVRLHVVDLTGRSVRTLLALEWLAAGRHSISWDGRDDGGRPTPAGLYYAVLQSNLGRASRAIVRLE